MKRTTLATALLLSSSFAMANTISGRVIDQMGNPVTEGEVQVMGSNKRVAIASDGSFSFTNVKLGKVELHVGSPNFIHSSTPVVVVDGGIAGVNITVTSSSIEVFDVTASAFHASNIESAAPVNVLAGDNLNHKQSATLGDTLRNEVGVHSSFHGGVASTPIIRGLDGPRVLITQNGMDASDASRVGPDHMVATETSSAQQIEVLRGPATLFYGSGAIGGVVNVVDQRIPDNNDAEGEFAITRNSVNAEEGVSGFVKGGANNFAFNAQGFYRDADNYRIPGFAESEDAHDDHEEEEGDHEGEHEHETGSEGVVESSQYTSKGFTVGGSYLFEQGHVGMSVQHLSSLYGIPGHAHEEEDAHSDAEHEDEMHSAETEMVMADLKQNRYQMAGEFQLSAEAISAINFGLSYTDYTHVEIENGEPGTRFSNNSFETRIEVLHQPIAGWRGGVSLHTKLSDFAAIGEEAYTPASDTRSFGLGIIEEKHFGDVLVQLGGRIERVEIDVPRIFAADLDVHEHDDDHMDEHMDEHIDEHMDEHDDAHDHDDMQSVALDFTPYSVSAGAVWDFTEGYNIGVSYVHAQRAPSSAELFSFGPHIGTQTYEVGALYQLEGETFEVGNADFELETSNNFDISLRKFAGDLGFVVNVFYNQVDDYYYAADTGLYAEVSHEHDDEHMDEHEGEEHMDETAAELDDGHSDELPVFAFVNGDATLYGAEFQINWKAADGLKLFTQGDIIKSEIDTGNGNEKLPRTPPARLTVGGEYSNQNWLVDAQVMRVFSQTDVAEFESSTDGYTMVDANVSYFTSIQGYDVEFFAKGRNLTDEEARVHTSFLKNLAPLPGRSVLLGVRASF